MKEIDIRKLNGCVLTIWNDAKKQNLTVPFTDISPVHEVFRQTGAYRIGYNGIKAIKDALDIISDSELGKRYSQQYLNEEIESLVMSLLQTPAKGIAKEVESIVQQWIEKLQSATDVEWMVIAPIANLTLEMDSLGVGDVTFLKNDTTEANAIIENINRVNAGTASPPDVRNYMVSLTNQRFSGRVLATVKIKTIDDKMAKALGQDSIEHALNVLRLYGFGVMRNNPLDYKMHMGIDGSVFTGKPVIATLKHDTANLTFDTSGALYGYIFTNEALNQMNQLSFQYLNLMLKKQEKGDFEKLLNTSIDFFGAGMHDQDLLDSFIDFIISLESLLLKEREPSKGLLAERVALIVGKDAVSRLEIFDFIEYLYQVRSNIVHRGFNAVTKENVKMIAFYSFSVLITLFSHAPKIKKIDDLVDICHKLKFGSPTFGN